jgi:glycosyltransferase involved in cell wall biosynthesis
MVKLSIIIPVYNEVAYFEQLLEKVRGVSLTLKKEIIIVESNSTDGTRDLVRLYEGKEGIHVIYQKKPMGKGSAVKEGLKAATGDIILIQDADLEYDTADYQSLIAPILDGEAGFVLGSRHLGKGTWKIRRFDFSRGYGRLVNVGSEALNFLFFLLYGVRLTDPQTMFKVFKRECISGLDFKSDYFQWDWEIVIKLVKRGYVPIEVPVSYTGRTVEEGKKIHLLRDGLLALWTIIKFRFVD